LTASDDDWLEAIIAGLARLDTIPPRVPEELRAQVRTLLASIDATPETASIEERVGALFLAWARIGSLSEADRLDHAVIGYVLHRGGYPSSGRLPHSQRQALMDLWQSSSRGMEMEPGEIGAAVWRAFYPRLEA
jgi:hypothetical protein